MDGDTSRMFVVGECSIKAKQLIKTTYDAMMSGIKTIKANTKIGNIGYAIQNIVEAKGFSVVRDFCGHGIGKNFMKVQISSLWRKIQVLN